MASRECPKIEIKKEKFGQFRGRLALLYIKYEDHVLFRNCNSSDISPSIRELVGWSISETDQYIRICNDMPVYPLLNEKRESGFIVLKNDILEMFEIIPKNHLRKTKKLEYGQKTSYKRRK